MPSHKEMEKIRDQLQKKVGKNPKIKVETFTNWAANQKIEPVLACTPKTVPEVQALVKGAKDLGLRVRAAGRTHSWTPLFADEGQIIVYMRELTRPLADGPQIELIQKEDEPNQKYATIASGANTGEFKEFQLTHGVCIPANVVLNVVQMGGVIATACHGTGFDTKTVSDAIVSMRIVDCNGELRTYSAKDDQDMMNAINCHLGLWGIMVDFTIKVEPMIIVETDNQWIPVKELFYDKEKMHKIINENWSVEIFWFPFNSISNWESIEAFMTTKIDIGEWDPREDLVWVRLINKPEKPDEILEDEVYEKADFVSCILSKGYDLVDGFVKKFPSCAPIFSKIMTSNLQSRFGNKTHQQLPHAVHFQTYIDTVPVDDTEWAFNMDEDCTNLMTSIQQVIDLIHKEAMAGRFPINMLLEIRFIADSDVYMAPAVCANPAYGGTGHTCYIEVLSLAETPGFKEFTIQVSDFWKVMDKARPHWNKSWDHLPGIDDFLRKAYADQIPKFLSALERSGADPSGMFFNSRLEEIFYPGGHPGKKNNNNDEGENTNPGPSRKEEQPKAKTRTCQVL